MRIWSLIIVCFLCAAARAEPVARPDDYAFGLALSTDGQSALYRVRLPAAVYERTAYGDLRDVAVFNAAGESLPVSLRAPERPPAEAGAGAALPFFPFRGDGADVREALRGGAHPAAPSDRGVSGYVIDADAVAGKTPGALELDWEGGQDGRVLSVRLDASHDLVSWAPLVANASLLRLHLDGHELARTRIDLPERGYRYLRLWWPAGSSGAVVTGVTAIPRAHTPAIEPLWQTPVGQRLEDREKVVYAYERSGRQPVDRVGMNLPDGNVLIEARVLSRPDEASPWRLRYDGAFYRLDTEGLLLVRDEVKMRPTSDPYWRLERRSESYGADGAALLRLGWAPYDLYFLAAGEGPFTLAYGAASPPPRTAADALLGRLEAEADRQPVPVAGVSHAVVLGGEARLEPPPPPFPWQRWVLWSVLVAGALLLGGMAWRLWRQMGADEGGSKAEG